MSKMMHDQPSAAVPASRDRRNFLIAGAGLALAATTLGRSGAVMAKPAGQDTPNAPSEAVPVQKETLTTRKLGSLEVSGMGLGCLPMVGYYGGGPRDRKAMVSLIRAAFEQGISHCRAVAPIRLPKVSLIKVNTCCHRETAGEVSLCIIAGDKPHEWTKL